jgi:multiple sugar transport system substrate-binding protein
MTSYESQKTLALEAGRAPTRKAVYQDPEIRAKMPHLIMFLPAFEKARPRPVSPVYPAISQELQRFFSRAITRKESDISRLAKAASVKIENVVKIGARLNP